MNGKIVKGDMGVKEDAATGELEEGELTSGSGNESDGNWGYMDRVRKFVGHDAVIKSKGSIASSSRRIQHYEPTPPRGYRTPAAQRLRDKWSRKSPNHNLKFKYHGTMDLIRKSSNNYSYPPNAQWRHPGNSPSPSRQPERVENLGSSPSVNFSVNNKDHNPQNLKELVAKKPLRKKIVPKNVNSIRPPPSPTGDVEDLDYIDLLLEYKQIQKQLEHLSKEEADSVTVPKEGLKLEQPDSCTAEEKTEVKLEAEGNDTQHDNVKEKPSLDKDTQEAITSESVAEIEEDEAQRLLEEEELNELRLAALASATRGVNQSTNERGPSERPQQHASNSHRGGSRTDATKRSKDAVHRENVPAKRRRPLEDARERNLRRGRDDRRFVGDRTRRDRDDWFRRDRDERRERERRRDDRVERRSVDAPERKTRPIVEPDLQKSDERTLSLARVLTLDSHEEQVDRFVQILQDRNAQSGSSWNDNISGPQKLMDSYVETVDNFVRRMQGDHVSTMRLSPRVWSKELDYLNRLFEDKIDSRDNYEEVEMDLGSGPASPVPGFIEVDDVPWAGVSRFPIEFPHSLPYDTDFLYNPVQQMDTFLHPNQVGIPPLLDPSSLHMNAAQPPPPPPPLPSHPPPQSPALPPLLPKLNIPDVEVVLSGDKVSLSAKSDSSEDDNQEPEDEEDEDLLRATLLYELAQKRRKRITNESSNSSPAHVEISPKVNLSLPRNDSSQSLQSMQAMPLVERMVITIGNDSSDESDSEAAKSSRKVAVGLDGQLDLFLAMQRQTVEEKLKVEDGQPMTDSPKKKNNRSDAVEIAEELETQLRKVRASLVQDDSRLNAVRSQLGKRKRALMTAELKAAKLREQLAAADRIITVTKEQTDRLNSEATRLQNRINNTYTQVEELEKHTLLAGKVAYGDAYNLGIHLQPQDSVQAKKTEVSNKSAVKSKEQLAEDFSREKARLKEREREVAVKLKALKEAQAKAKAKNKTTARMKQKRLKMKTKDASEHIHTTPVMSFNFGPEVENEMTVITPKRRRSLADLSPSTVPNLPNLSQEFSSTLPDKITEEKEENPIPLKPKVKFVMPSSKQMSSLNRMLGVSKMPASARHSNLTVKYRFDTEECLKTSELNVVSGNKSVKQSGNSPTVLRKYNSPLQMFRGYRISPYFRTKSKNGLTSETYCHKIDHQRLLCHYDLHGKCQDEKCAWQHKDSYIISKKEVLMDIAAYLPGIADIKPKSNPQEVHKKLEEFVEEFQKKNAQFSHEQQCLLLLSDVISKAQKKLPHMMPFDARKWKPAQPRSDVPSTVADTKVQWFSKGSQDLSRNDDVLLDGDIRYWMLGTSEIQDMETAVMESPNNINLWINLANKKLHNPKQSNEKNIESCLNVLSRGLELNRNSSDLWLYYLKIFSQRNNNSEMLHLCEQALKYAPTYHLHCKYINFLESYQSCEGHCDVLLKWLVTQADVSSEERSHWILETLLYKVALATNCGRFRNALKALQQVVLGGGNGPEWIPELLAKLTVQDTSLLWLCYIHLVEFRFLPPSLFDPANAHRSTIVSKEPFLFPWEMGKPTRNSVDYLESRFKEAVEIVKAKESDNKLSDYEWHIHRNWILMEVVCKRLDNARNKCRQLLQEHNSKSVEIWLLLFSIEKSTEDIAQARKVLQEAQEQYPFSSYLVHNAAMFELSHGDVDSALEKLEFGVVSMFDVSLDDKRADPNLLYCKCLSQPLPLQYSCPDMKEKAQATDLSKQNLYLWLNYWLLLELHGDRTQANEVFELALGMQKSSESIHTLWRRYIQYQLYQLSQRTSGSTSTKVTESKLVDLLYRALLSSPSKAEVPLQPGVFWSNYSSHNDVIDMVLGCLPDHCLTPFLEKLIVWMPDNVVLMQRACEHFIKEGNRAAARGISMTTLQHHPACLSLWKIHMAQVQREGSYSEVKKLYRRALKHVDLTLSLWKDLLVFEMVCGNEKSVEQVIAQCEEKGLNIHDFLASICGNGGASVLPSAPNLGPKVAKKPQAKS